MASMRFVGPAHGSPECRNLASGVSLKRHCFAQRGGGLTEQQSCSESMCNEPLDVWRDVNAGTECLAPLPERFGHGAAFEVACEHLRNQRAPRRHLALRHRSEEHTSELQSRLHLVCRLLLEKKKK